MVTNSDKINSIMIAAESNNSLSDSLCTHIPHLVVKMAGCFGAYTYRRLPTPFSKVDSA